ncbi:MAG: VCBS repeat-containing protein, partial [Vicinamibacterales bacterium]
GAGLVAFAITMLVGHPLLVPEVAFTFWLVLGAWAATARATDTAVPEPVTSRGQHWLVPAMTAAMLLSLVIRVPAARKAVDLEHVDYGFSAPLRGPGGDNYRRVERVATFFAPADPRLTNAVELPLMADGDPAEVEFSFDGRPADRQRIEGRWRTIRLRVPPGSHAFRRVDIRTNVPVRIGKIKFNHAVVGEVAAVEPPRRRIVPADFDGDGRSDVVIFRPRTGAWHIKLSSAGFAAGAGANWGQPGDIPVVGDYDGDGHADTAVFRPNTGDWLIQPWGGGQAARIVQTWGLPGDIPVPADYDGDGRTDLAVFRPREGVWYLRLSRNGLVERRAWGVDGDVPVPGDYDDDGRADAAVYRPAERRWHLNLSAGDQVVQWDADAGYAMSGDFDGDGVDDLAGWQPATREWRIRRRSGEVRTVTFGNTSDVPVPGRYRSAERVDIAVFRPRTGKWFVPDLSTIDFGRRGDLPVLAAKSRSVASMTAETARVAGRLP